MNIFITGDQSYSNRIKIRKLVQGLKNKEDIAIATLNKQYGADMIMQQQ